MPTRKASRQASRPASRKDENWDRPKLKKILSELAGLKVVVVGDLGVDRYTIGSVERISPEAPVPIVLVEEELLKLGLAANVADNIQALGGVPLLTGVVGADRTAEDFRKLLKSSGIPAGHLIVDRNRRTVLKERVVSERQQLLRVDYESLGPVNGAVEGELIAKAAQLISKCDAVILEDYAKGLLSQRVAQAVIEEARRSGKVVSVDPNAKTDLTFYRGATILTPNTKEAEALAGIKITDADSLSRVGRKILKSCDARHVVITRGKEGMAIFSAGKSSVTHIPTFAREVYDVSGAGDTVISVLTMALAAGANIEEAAILGNLAGGVEVGKRGTATVTPDEVAMALDFFEKIGV